MAIPFIDFRPAQVMRNKEVYVCYYVLDPTNDRLKRMRIRCNRIKNRREQLKYAVLLCSEINRKLYNGWNPLTGEDSAAQKRVSIVEAATDHVRRKAKDLRKDTVRTPPRYRALQTYGLCGCPLPGLTLPVQSPPSAAASASLHPCESVIPPAPTEAGGTLDGTSISLRIATKKYYFCTVEQACMTHDRTYRPVPYVPAPRLRDADGSMRPLLPC